MNRNFLSAALIALLAGCTAERAPADDAATPSAVDQPAVDAAAAAPDASQPAPSAEESTPQPLPTVPDGDRGLARFDGYGDIRFGTAAADMPKAWGGELVTLGKEGNASCYFMTPKWVKAPAEFNFMIGDGKFVRFGTESDKFVAPGGGKVGMREAELQALYKNALQAAPHKYVEGGKYLSIAASGVAPGKLVFEVDAEGVVTEWRVGLVPHVDYVEGCS